MIKRERDLKVETIPNMRGGSGIAEIVRFLEGGEFHDKGRLFGKITLKPGVSIGLHQHVNDCEAFYILTGEGIYNDNGKEISIKSGDILYCEDGESHSIMNTGDRDLAFIALILFV